MTSALLQLEKYGHRHSTLSLRASTTLFLSHHNRHSSLVRSVGYEPVDVLWLGTPYPSYDVYGPIEAYKVLTVLSGSRPHRSGTSRRYAHPTTDLVRAVSCPEGQGSSLSQRPLDTDQPARARVGTRLGSAHRVGGTRHSESLGQS